MKIAGYTILVGLNALLLLAALWVIFGYAPIDANMGIIQKVFYFHISSAYLMYLGWTTCAVASIAYLIKRGEKWDVLAKCAAELALVFALILLITGPLWGRVAWGAYWTWDPRLTTSLLLALIIVAYTLLRYLATGEVKRRFAAALAILGALIMPIIHLSVHQWRGQHPAVITGKGGGLAPEMKLTLMISLVAFTALYITLLIRRYALEKHQRKLSALKNELALRGLGEEI